MKVAAIKPLVETYSIEQLRQAEEDLYNDQPLSIEVEGGDEGEKLTHILAAIEILHDMAKGIDYKTALRNYSSRVRNSIN
jgi:hypothetical protein